MTEFRMVCNREFMNYFIFVIFHLVFLKCSSPHVSKMIEYENVKRINVSCEIVTLGIKRPIPLFFVWECLTSTPILRL